MEVFPRWLLLTGLASKRLGDWNTESWRLDTEMNVLNTVLLKQTALKCIDSSSVYRFCLKGVSYTLKTIKL